MPKTALVFEGSTPAVSTADSGLSISELERYASEWFVNCEYEQLSPTTIEVRRIFLKNLLWFLQHRKFQTCDTSELKQFMLYLGTGHEEPGGRWGNPHLKKPLRPHSIKDYHTCLLYSSSGWLRRRLLMPRQWNASSLPKLVKKSSSR